MEYCGWQGLSRSSPNPGRPNDGQQNWAKGTRMLCLVSSQLHRRFSLKSNGGGQEFCLAAPARG
eukprot:2819908-Amphidinium_carterae.1